MKNNPANSLPAGFTLIELVVAMTILAFLSVMTYQSLSVAVRNKVKLQTELKTEAEVREALNIMVRDIELAMNYQDIQVAVYNLSHRLLARKKQTARPNPNPAGANPNQDREPDPDSEENPIQQPNTLDVGVQGPPAFVPREQPRVSFFIGRENELNLTTRSHVRRYRDAQESELAEVGYRVKTCPVRLQKTERGNCLWRRLSTWPDLFPEKGGTESVLLEDVKNLEFRYLGPIRVDEWQSRWITEVPNGGVATDVGRQFPFAVEINIVVKNPKPQAKEDLKYSALATVQFPNNVNFNDQLGSSQNNPNGAEAAIDEPASPPEDDTEDQNPDE